MTRRADDATAKTRPRIVILGPQGVGKGTQAARLAWALDIEHLSTGELLRRAVSIDSPLGRSVEAHLRRGDLVPDDVMVSAVRAEIEHLADRDSGFILDGYPRTLGQSIDLVAALDRPLTATIELTASLDVVLRRLLRRRVCPCCGASTAASASYVDTIPCPAGDGVAVRRTDDTPAMIAHRLALYDNHRGPLVAWLKSVSPFLSVSSDRSPDEVGAEILDELGSMLGAAEFARPSLDLAQAG